MKHWLITGTNVPFISLFVVIAKDSTNTNLAASGVFTKDAQADADGVQTTETTLKPLTKAASNSEYLFPKRRCGTFSNYINNITTGTGVNDTAYALYKGKPRPRVFCRRPCPW